MINSNVNLRVGGVPEHFNLPWLQAIEKGEFETKGIALDWVDIPEGSGKMAECLGNGSLDLAVILTDGFIKAVDQGIPLKAIGFHVLSPLYWGVHAGGGLSPDELAKASDWPFLISRYGSGSHLMATVYAEKQGWPTKALEFEVINTLAGAIEKFSTQPKGLFLWERSMTLPHVNAGQMQQIDVIPSPWPSFVIAVNDKLLKEKTMVTKIPNLLEIIFKSNRRFAQSLTTINEVMSKYNIPKAQVEEWLASTKWEESHDLHEKDVQKAVNLMHKLGLIEKEIPIDHLLFRQTKV